MPNQNRSRRADKKHYVKFAEGQVQKTLAKTEEL